MSPATHIWRTTRRNTRKNRARATPAAVLFAAKMRAMAEGLVGNGGLRVVAFDDNVVVHDLPKPDPEEVGPSTAVACWGCSRPVAKRWHRWRSCGRFVIVDELDVLRDKCYCVSARSTLEDGMLAQAVGWD